MYDGFTLGRNSNPLPDFSLQQVSANLANNGSQQAVLLPAGRRGYSAQRVSKTSEGAIAPHPVAELICVTMGLDLTIGDGAFQFDL